MKKLFENYFSKGGFVMLASMILCAIFGVMDASVLGAAATVTDFEGSSPNGPAEPANVPNNTGGEAAGIQSPGNDITAELIRNESDQILLTAYDRIIVNFKPYLNPLDTLMRYVEQRPEGDASLEIRWGASDVKAVSATLTNAYTATSPGSQTADLVVSNAQLFAKTQTIRVIAGTNEVDTLTISAGNGTEAATSVIVELNGTGYSIPIVSGATAINVADAIRAWEFPNWNTGGTVGTAVVTFTRTVQDVVVAPVFISGTSGIAGTFAVTTAGGVLGSYAYDGVTPSTEPLSLYVQARNYGTNTLTVIATNGPRVTPTSMTTVPSIPANATFYRLGRAAAEKDIQTEPYNTIPTFSSNFMQSFKCQIEISKWFKKSKKNVKWDEADVENTAKFEYKREIESSFLYGTKSKIRDNGGETPKDVLMCNGISKYITQSFDYEISEKLPFGWSKDNLVDFHKQLFLENIGSNKRIVFAGADLLASISKIDYVSFKDISREVKVMFGIEWDTIKTVFGETYWVHMPLMDEIGESTEGYAIDPQYLYKYTFEAQNDRNIDKVTSGEAYVDASVTTEVTCPAVAYPKCHMKIHMTAA